MSKWSLVAVLVLLVLTSAMGLKALNTAAPMPPSPWLAANTAAPMPPSPWLVANTAAPMPPSPW